MGIFFNKPLYKYNPLERVRIDIDKVKSYDEKRSCDLVGETNDYRIYIYKENGAGIGRYFLRQEKTHPKRVAYLGRARGHYCVFHDKVFTIDSFSSTGHTRHPLICKDINTGAQTEMEILSPKGFYEFIGTSMHLYCQDVVQSIEVNNDVMTLKVCRYPAEATLTKDTYHKEFVYHIHIKRPGGNFVVEKEFPEENEKEGNAMLSERERYGQAWLQIVKNDRAKGLQTMRELSSADFIEGTIALAMFSEIPSERKALYKKAADTNHPEGLWGYSGYLQHSFCPDPSDPQDAEWEKICLKAAQNGSVDAMNELGNVFNRRNQFPQSMYWYAMANAHDFPNGEVSLQGLAKKWLNAGKPYGYEETEGFTEANYKCALFYLESWSEQEISTPIDEYISMNLAGEPLAAYLTGDVFEAVENYEAAYRMYNAIAFENDAHGIKCLGDMLLVGRGTKADEHGAIKAYANAAELGDRAAMFAVGEFTKNTNANLAAYWYGVAHSRGYQPALQRMIQLANKQ